jgi:hypothetical protein
LPELADIFRDWRGRFTKPLTTEQCHAIRDICACRTPEMERGALYSCPDCGTTHFGWQSCGNRNCPKCGNDKITKWLAKRQKETLPVDYYMITFTLPAELRWLCKHFPKKVYKAFFAAASSALKQLALDKRFLGAEIGMIGTLQTWRRDGGFHPHIHFLVPGGGLSQDGSYWVFPKSKKVMLASSPLAKLFKGKFKGELEKLNLLKSAPQKAWKKEWVVDCKNVGNGMSSFKYLGTYMQRVFISNDRIEKYDGENVTFRYKNSTSGQLSRRTMPALVFMEMFLQHVLPSGFQKTRYYGLLGSARKKVIREIRIMILTSRGQPPTEPEEFSPQLLKCSKCGAEMALASIGARGPPPGAVVI